MSNLSWLPDKMEAALHCIISCFSKNITSADWLLVMKSACTKASSNCGREERTLSSGVETAPPKLRQR